MATWATDQLDVKSVFITGANRGIGLELVRQFLKISFPPQHVFATYRTPEKSQDLLQLASSHANLHPLKFEVTDYDALNDLVSEIEKHTDQLTLLINNAGLITATPNGAQGSLEDSTADEMRTLYETNTIAPLMITKAFLPLLKKSAASSTESGMSISKAAIMNISSRIASMTDNTSGGLYAYRASKAALNSVTVSCSVNLKEAGILVAALHPGWVKTGLGGSDASTDATESVECMMNVMAGLTENSTGKFLHFKGDELPW